MLRLDKYITWDILTLPTADLLHGIILGLSRTSTSAVFSTPFWSFFDMTFLLAIHGACRVVESLDSLLSPSLSTVISLSHCQLPVPTFSLTIMSPWQFGMRTGITVSVVACLV